MKATPRTGKVRSGLVFGVACVVVVLTVLVAGFWIIALQQKAKQDDAYRVTALFQRAIRAQDPKFKRVSTSLSTWFRHRPLHANFWDRTWNIAYPAIDGDVTSDRLLGELREMVRRICDEQEYEFEHVAFFVNIRDE